MSLLDADISKHQWRQRALAAEKRVLELEKIVQEQAQKIQKLEGELAELKRMIFGKRSEKMPSISSQLKKKLKK